MPEEQVPYEVEQDDKVCPLRMINAHDRHIYPGSASGKHLVACLRDKCAWWAEGQCAIYALAYHLDHVVDCLAAGGE